MHDGTCSMDMSNDPRVCVEKPTGTWLRISMQIYPGIGSELCLLRYSGKSALYWVSLWQWAHNHSAKTVLDWTVVKMRTLCFPWRCWTVRSHFHMEMERTSWCSVGGICFQVVEVPWNHAPGFLDPRCGRRWSKIGNGVPISDYNGHSWVWALGSWIWRNKLSSSQGTQEILNWGFAADFVDMFNVQYISMCDLCQDAHELQAGHSCAGRSAAVGSAPVPEILWITASRYAQLSSRVAMAKIVVTVQKMTGEETVIEVDPQETAQTGMGSWR